MKSVRSPFFYVGDKYKLMEQINKIMPSNINRYVEPFVGGGSSALNVRGKEYILNDIDNYVIRLHEELSKYKNNHKLLYKKLFSTIQRYELSCSFRGYTVPDELKTKHKKTYYARFNKTAYMSMRDDYNARPNNILLYLLLIYGFNHMIRFNKQGKFNLPVGNVDFNKNVYKAIEEYLNFMKKNKVEFSNCDYKIFLDRLDLDDSDYVFLDPPYLISMSEYNKLWDEDKERELCLCLDELNAKRVRFGITNLVFHKNKENKIFREWSKKYNVFDISSNYISYHDNTVKDSSKEVFVTNYGTRT